MPTPVLYTAALSSRLLGQCVEGDARAWESLYAQHAEMTRNFLYRLGVENELLDDAVQDVFLEAFRYLPTFRGDSTFKTWLYRLCSTQARKARKKRHLRLMLERLHSALPFSFVTEGELPAEHAGRLMERGLSRLPDGERLVFVLYELEGMSGKEIAEIAGCPESTVWRRLHYARKSFVEYVQENGGAQ